MFKGRDSHIPLVQQVRRLSSHSPVPTPVRTASRWALPRLGNEAATRCCCMGRLEDVDPHAEHARVDLVQLVKVAVDDGVIGQAVLAPCAQDQTCWDLFPCGSLVVGLHREIRKWNLAW